MESNASATFTLRRRNMQTNKDTGKKKEHIDYNVKIVIAKANYYIPMLRLKRGILSHPKEK